MNLTYGNSINIDEYLRDKHIHKSKCWRECFPDFPNKYIIYILHEENSIIFLQQAFEPYQIDRCYKPVIHNINFELSNKHETIQE